MISSSGPLSNVVVVAEEEDEDDDDDDDSARNNTALPKDTCRSPLPLLLLLPPPPVDESRVSDNMSLRGSNNSLDTLTADSHVMQTVKTRQTERVEKKRCLM